MFPSRQDLLDMIPEPEDMSPTKLLGGMVSTDTCNTARLTRQTLCNAIIQQGREMGLGDDKLTMYQGNCHQHLRNILVNAGANYLSSKLSHLLCEDLGIIPPAILVTFSVHVIRNSALPLILQRDMVVCFMHGWKIPSGIITCSRCESVERKPTGCIVQRSIPSLRWPKSHGCIPE